MQVSSGLHKSQIRPHVPKHSWTLQDPQEDIKFGGQAYFSVRTWAFAEQKENTPTFLISDFVKWQRIFFFISTNIKQDLTNITAVHLLL